MKKLKHIALDMFILWPVMYFAIIDGQLWADNIMSFFAGLSITAGVGGLFAVKEIAEGRKSRGDQPKSGFYKAYIQTSTALEVLIFASAGWYWCAAGWVLTYIVTIMADDKLVELTKE